MPHSGGASRRCGGPTQEPRQQDNTGAGFALAHLHHGANSLCRAQPASLPTVCQRQSRREASLDAEAKKRFVRLLRRQARFCGLELLAYCVTSNPLPSSWSGRRSPTPPRPPTPNSAAAWRPLSELPEQRLRRANTRFRLAQQTLTIQGTPHPAPRTTEQTQRVLIFGADQGPHSVYFNPISKPSHVKSYRRRHRRSVCRLAGESTGGRRPRHKLG